MTIRERGRGGLITAIAMGAVLVALVALGLVVVVRRSLTPPWGSMERALATVPVPPGARRVHLGRNGARCLVGDCYLPAVTDWLVTDPVKAPCQDLDWIASRWTAHGRKFVRDKEDGVLIGGCGLSGHFGPYPASIGIPTGGSHITVSIGDPGDCLTSAGPCTQL